jgi:hypothetical protein
MQYMLAIIFCFVAHLAFAQAMPAVNTAPSGCSGGQPLSWNGSAWACSAPKLSSTTVTALPTCNSGAAGAQYLVTDALTPVALSAPVGGGAVPVSVICNGSTYIVQ